MILSFEACEKSYYSLNGIIPQRRARTKQFFCGLIIWMPPALIQAIKISKPYLSTK